MKLSLVSLMALCIVACSSKKAEPTLTNPDPNNPAPTQTTETPPTPPAPSDTTTPPEEVPDSSSPPPVDAGSDAPLTTEQCIAACEQKFPTGHVQGLAIDQCWTKSCAPSCTLMEDRLPNGQMAKAVPVDGGKQCGYDGVLTPSPSCSACTQEKCCVEWSACFSNVDSECSQLNRCALECYNK